MRICCRCESKMIEGFDIKVEGAGYGIKVATGTGVFANRIEKPKVAVCPNCGEISLYIINLDNIADKSKE